ncbi:MAG: ABC1 kinase family protein, partial [Bdellovibrionota bacterium]
DAPEHVNAFLELCLSLTEPFFTPEMPGVLPDFFDADGAYDFGRSDLPKRAIAAGKRFAFDAKLRPPPREVVFLDRKMGGLFIMLSVLRARVKVRPILERYLSDI